MHDAPSKMHLSTGLQSWYAAKDGSIKVGDAILNNDEPTLAHAAFQAAAKEFFPNTILCDTSNGSKSSGKLAWSMESVKDMVVTSMATYECSRGHTKVRKWLAKFAAGLNFYANVMDMLVQQHPEYVALAWGAMKVLIVAVVNHEKVLTLLAKSLSAIGESLPRVELATILYPTERMRQTVEKLYSLILKFFLRAHNWSRESTFSHMIHSITRPAELHYVDLLEQIGECSRRVDQLALSGSQAELRDMHLKMDLVLGRLDGTDHNIQQLVNQMSAAQALASSAVLDTNQQLSDIQFSQIVAYLSGNSFPAPLDAHRRKLMMQRRLSPRDRKRIIEPLKSSAKLQGWASSTQSAMIHLRSSFRQRQTINSFIISIVEKVRETNLPCIEALGGICSNLQEQYKTSVDLLKFLILQALSINDGSKNEKSLALTYRQFHNAVTEDDWLKLFQRVILSTERPVYVFMDVGSFGFATEGSKGFSFLTAFLVCIQNLQELGFKGKLKVLLLSWGPHTLPQLTENSLSSLTIIVRDGHTRFLKSRSLPRRGVSII